LATILSINSAVKDRVNTISKRAKVNFLFIIYLPLFIATGCG
jgi:hypothetical protein